MKQAFFAVLGLVFCVAPVVPGHAETVPRLALATPPQPDGVPGAEDDRATALMLQRLNDQAAILEVQSRIADARRKIAVAEKEMGAAAAPTAGAPAPPAVAPPAAANVTAATESHIALPHVMVISGTGREISAELALPDGGDDFVHVGSGIRGVGQVLAISDAGVVVDVAGERVTLPIGSDGVPGQAATPAGFPLAPPAGFARLPQPSPPRGRPGF